MASARADEPAYVCDWKAVFEPCAIFDASLRTIAPERRWPAPPPIALPKVTMSGWRSQHSERKQPVPPGAGAAPWRPRPHMISSQTTAMPRDLASAMYACSRAGGHGIPATDEPHCGSISSTPSSLSYLSR